MNAFALAALHGSGWSRSASAAKVLQFHDLRAICDSGIAMVSARRGFECLCSFNFAPEYAGPKCNLGFPS